MTAAEINQAVEQLKQFANRWNELYATQKFEEMKYLATEDVGIATRQSRRINLVSFMDVRRTSTESMKPTTDPPGRNTTSS